MFAADLNEEFVRYLYKDARAVAGLGVGSRSAAVGQAIQDLQALLNCIIGFPAFDIADKAHAAGIMLKLGIVQPVLFHLIMTILIILRLARGFPFIYINAQLLDPGAQCITIYT
jgi:hypothetical protein